MTKVELGSISDTFTGGSSGYVSKKGNGATLTDRGDGTFLYVAPDGTEIVYLTWADPVYVFKGFACRPEDANGCSIPISMRRPDGTLFTISWQFYDKCKAFTPGGDCGFGTSHYRFRGVSSSAGYAFTVYYATDNPGTGNQPVANWRKQTVVQFTNTLAPPSPLPTVSYAYPSASSLEVTDIGGRTWRFAYGADGRLVSIRRPGVATDTTVIGYGANGVSSVTKDGVTTSYSRVVSGSTGTTTVTNALNQQTVVVSDLAKGRPTSVTDALNRTTSYQYDANSRLTRVTEPEGNYVELTLDARGNVTQTQMAAKAASGLAPITTSATFAASCANPKTCNRPLTSTDARGFITDFTYDPTHGGLLTVTQPAQPNGVRPQTRYGYTLLNGEYQLTSVSACQTTASCAGTADEVKATLGYDSNGNATSVSAGAGDGSLTAASAMIYDAIGNLLTVDGPLAGNADTTRYRYNAARELVGTISADPDGGGVLKHRAIRNTIDAQGLLTKTESGTVNSQSDADWAAFVGSEAVETGYDANARPVTSKLTSGGTTYALTQTSYDALGRPECTAQRMNPAAFGSLPANACTLGAAGSFGPDRIGKMLYDAAAQATQARTALGTADEAAEASLTYRPNGQVETLTDGENNRTTYVYDGHDRLSRTHFPVPQKGAALSSATDYEEFGYEGAANIVWHRRRGGDMIQFGHDALGRMMWKDVPNVNVDDEDILYGYDNLGRMVLAQKNPINRALFAYDALGRKTGESNYYYALTSQYDAAGRRTRLTWNDGFFVTYDHLVTGDMSAIRENGSFLLASFGYDDLGRRTSLTRGNGTVTSYGYDAVSRLASLVQDLGSTAHDLNLTFSYNPASQITSNTRSNDIYAWTGHGNGTTSSTANGLNQLTQTGGTALTYDGRGNVTAIGGQAYAYTSQNRLWHAPGLTELRADALDRLDYISATSLLLGHDGNAMVAEYAYVSGPGPLQRRFVHGPGVDEPLVWYEGSGTGDKRYLHADERGSIIAVSDSAGAAIGINKYDEYGKSEGTLLGRFGYTGQAYVPEIGLYYYKARMYWPDGPRFMQTDTIGYAGGMNGYVYPTDPVNFTDPMGMVRQPNEKTWSESYNINPTINDFSWGADFSWRRRCVHLGSWDCGWFRDFAAGSAGGAGGRGFAGGNGEAPGRGGGREGVTKPAPQEQSKDEVCRSTRSAASDIRKGNKVYAAVVGAGFGYYIARHAIHAIHVARTALILVGGAARGAAVGTGAGAVGGPWGAAAGALAGVVAGGALAYTEATGKTTMGADIVDSFADALGCRKQ